MTVVFAELSTCAYPYAGSRVGIRLHVVHKESISYMNGNAHPYHIVNLSSKHGHLLNLLAMLVRSERAAPTHMNVRGGRGAPIYMNGNMLPYAVHHNAALLETRRGQRDC